MIYWIIVMMGLSIVTVLFLFVNHVSMQRNIEEYSFISAAQMKVIIQRNRACLILMLFMLIIGIVFLGVLLGGRSWLM
jgi:hypothetical protein|nr:MAG TPA: hypothetical protein [Caudoviricetes sp.]